MKQQIQQFNETLWNHFAQHGRDELPWRQPQPDGAFDPYKILVSELMLQQTQVGRVIPKYHEFLMKFPTVAILAAAEQADVLRAWSGLGYNRRARFLHQAVQRIMTDYGGRLPTTVEALVQLPGIGKNTAGAVMAYAYNQPVVYLETNVRTVYIHHFFHDQADVPDAAISDVVAQTLDHEHPREFYWALMDYGSFLKQTVGNASRQSAGYSKQSKFAGSPRQLRGQVLRALAAEPLTLEQLRAQLPDERLPGVLGGLVSEGLVIMANNRYKL